MDGTEPGQALGALGRMLAVAKQESHLEKLVKILMSVPQTQKWFDVSSLRSAQGISIFHVPQEIPVCSSMKKILT